MYIIYTNSVGQQTLITGWSADVSLFGGRLDVQVARWGPGALDWDYRGLELARHTYEGADLSQEWATMVNVANQIDQANIKYTLLYANSNAVVNTVVAAAGLPSPPC